MPAHAPLEHVLLRCTGGPVAYTVPRGAARAIVPEGDGAPADVAGVEFERTGDDHPELLLPLFRRRSRQL